MLLKIRESYIHFILKANGKADIYFHAYFWVNFLSSLYIVANGGSVTYEDFETNIMKSNPEVLRLKGLSESLKKVASSINKFAFNQ